MFAYTVGLSPKSIVFNIWEDILLCKANFLKFSDIDKFFDEIYMRQLFNIGKIFKVE